MLAVWHSSHLSIYIATALMGLGIGFSFAAMANLIVEAVDQSQTGVATGMNTIMRTIGGAIGGQVAASIIAGHIVAGGFRPRAATRPPSPSPRSGSRWRCWRRSRSRAGLAPARSPPSRVVTKRRPDPPRPPPRAEVAEHFHLYASTMSAT